jgi:hypothetical protein
MNKTRTLTSGIIHPPILLWTGADVTSGGLAGDLRIYPSAIMPAKTTAG